MNQYLKYITTGFFCFLFLSDALSQSPKLQGIVIDGNTKEPLYNANVYLLLSQKGTITDRDGYFELYPGSADKNDTLVVTFLGYTKFQVPVTDFANKSTIQLQAEILQSEKGITVYAEKLDLARQEMPHIISTIDPEQIQRYASSEISTLFKLEPAVRIEGNDLDGRSIQIRGSDPDEVNVYVDGILINSVGFNNAADLSVIPAANIYKLEILKGSNLILLGSGAFGGVINITTRRTLEPEYGLQLKYGTSDSKYISADVNIPLSRRLLVNYFGMASSFAPRIEYYPSERYDAKTTASDITTRKQNHNLTLNYYDDHGQFNGKLLGYSFDYQKPTWKNESRSLFAAASYQGDFLRGKDFDFSTQYIFSDDVSRRRSSGSPLFISDYLSQRLHIRITKNYSTSSAASRQIGLQLLSEYFHDELSVNRSIKTSLGKDTYYHASLYDNRASAGGILSIGDNLDRAGTSSWKIYAGMRGDFPASGKNYKVSTYGLQITVNRSNWTYTPYLSYGENVKFPSLLDNAYQTDVLDLAITGSVLNPVPLKPESNNSAEAGFTLQFRPENVLFDKIDFSLAVFSNHVANKILKRPLENAIVQTQIGVNTTTGIETSIKWSGIFSNWNLLLAYEKLHIENPLIYAFKPDQNLSAQLEYTTAFGFYCTSTLFYAGRSLAWDYNERGEIFTRELEPYLDLDLIAGYSFPLGPVTFQLQAAGYNIFDNAGYRFYYLAKRFLQIGLNLKY